MPHHVWAGVFRNFERIYGGKGKDSVSNWWGFLTNKFYISRLQEPGKYEGKNIMADSQALLLTFRPEYDIRTHWDSNAHENYSWNWGECIWKLSFRRATSWCVHSEWFAFKFELIERVIRLELKNVAFVLYECICTNKSWLCGRRLLCGNRRSAHNSDLWDRWPHVLVVHASKRQFPHSDNHCQIATYAGKKSTFGF